MRHERGILSELPLLTIHSAVLTAPMRLLGTARGPHDDSTVCQTSCNRSSRFMPLGVLRNTCRREPDFESQFPAISALCRGKLFAPRLNPDDLVAYILLSAE